MADFCFYCGKPTWKTTVLFNGRPYHPRCQVKEADLRGAQARVVPSVEVLPKVSPMAPPTPALNAGERPLGASFLIISGVVLFVGIVLVLANAVRERPVYTDAPEVATAAAATVSTPAVAVSLPTPSTVVVIEKVVERVVYLPTTSKPSGSKKKKIIASSTATVVNPSVEASTPPEAKKDSDTSDPSVWSKNGCGRPRKFCSAETLVECQEDGFVKTIECIHGCAEDHCSPPGHSTSDKAHVPEPMQRAGWRPYYKE